MTDDMKALFRKLESILEGYGSMVVAYSGGVDSALLAYAAWKVLGTGSLAVIGVSPSLAQREREQAEAFLREHAIAYETVETEEMDSADYRSNNPDRCYHCKSELFSKLRRVADAHDLAYIAYGANVDDEKDFRPGGRAAREHRAIAPLAEAGLGKNDIRRLARSLSLDVWDKPAAPCLASRIPYYSTVDSGKLNQIERAENALKDAGFPVGRVRHHGDVARIELPHEDCIRILSGAAWKILVEKIKGAGFRYVTLDVEGFKSGRLNEAVDDSTKARAVDP